MNSYRTLVPITLRGVVLKLEGDQLRRRQNFVRALEGENKGLFAPITEVQFKAGEVVVTRDPLPKVFWDKVEKMSSEQRAPSADGDEPKLQDDSEEEKPKKSRKK